MYVTILRFSGLFRLSRHCTEVLAKPKPQSKHSAKPLTPKRGEGSKIKKMWVKMRMKSVVGIESLTESREATAFPLKLLGLMASLHMIEE